MKESIPYSLFSTIVCRTPLFPYSFIKPLIISSDTSDETLKEYYRQPIIREAIFIASPELQASLEKWIDGKITIPKRVKRIRTSIIRYLIRMATRPTPFGLFAGLSMGTWDKENKFVFSSINKYKKHSRLDMNYLCTLADDLSKIQKIKENIYYYPNRSIYKVGNKLRYVEYKQKNYLRNYNIVSIDNSDYLKIILEQSKNGAQYNELINLLSDDEITYDESKDFIDELIESQVLVSDLEPSVTGTEYLEYIINILSKIKGIDEIKRALKNIKNGLQNVDSKPIGSGIRYYNKLIDEIDTLKTEYKRKYLFQVDMYKSTEQLSLKQNTKNEILRSMEVLNKLSLPSEKADLINFKDEFFGRYEEREVPLMEVLDTDIGIGYKQTRKARDISPLVDDILLPIKTEDKTFKFNNFDLFLLKKYINAIKNGIDEIEITDADLKTFEAKWDDLPETISATISVKPQKNDDKDEILLSFIGNSSAANMLGRFCYTNRIINDIVIEIIEKETNNNSRKIFAEITHLPESRTGNVLVRPSLRKYEIPYLVRSGVSEDHQINTSDLLISVKNNRIILRSKLFNKEIVPRMANAHNYKNNSLPVYEFLCDMQYHDVRHGIGFNWNPIFYEFDFLPRVRYRNTIFSLANWQVKIEELEKINTINNDKTLLKAVEAWRITRKLPIFVVFKDGDNTLLLNLQNCLCIKTLLSIVKNRHSFLLTEPFMIPQDINEWKEDEHINEFVFSFYRKHENEKN